MAGADPRLMNFQGRLTDTVGSPVADGIHSVTFRCFTSSSGGVLLWQETQNVTTTKGIFSVLLGAVDSLRPGVFSGDLASVHNNSITTNAFVNFDNRAWFPAPNYVVMKLWHDHFASQLLALEGPDQELNFTAAKSDDGKRE